MIQNVPLLGCSPVLRLSADGGGSDALLQTFSTQQLQGDKSRLRWRLEWCIHHAL